MDVKVMSGLEFLKAMQKAGNRPPMAETMNVDLDCIEDGLVRFKCIPTNDHLNPGGTVHGGYAATALDSVLSLAVQTKLKDAFNFRGTSELNVKYIRPIKVGQVLYAEGRVVSMTRQTGISAGEIVDEEGKIYAYASGTVMIKPES
ncbi:Thioesterase superfamily protein [Pseudovibrio sp. W64]|uniref:PaaI family thioesterase n=1 Tax=Pseudovibrio sp. W64 TaxID=1735583 RepID=UPI0007AEAF77|nr:PaaI family thioesterase [Pseudovibrio sp. W64]KZK84363.1 Thioesterase superfamily protein [Pseudovibrio sp. W64]